MPCSLARPLGLGTVSTPVSPPSRVRPAAPPSRCAPASRTSPPTVWSPRWCRRRASTRSASTRTCRTRTSPSQAEAVTVLRDFAAGLGGAHGRRPPGAAGSRRGRPRRPTGPAGSTSTAVTASARPICWPRCGTPTPAAARAEGVRHLRRADQPGRRARLPADGRRRCSGHRLLCIDEFELDDPGDTVLVSPLLGRLVDAGVRARRDLQHAARQARRGPVRRRRLPAGDPGAVRPLPPAADRRRGLPPPRAARGPGAVLRRAGHRGGVRAPRARRSTTSARCSTTWLGSTPAATARCATVCGRSSCAGCSRSPTRPTALRLVVLADRLYDREVPVMASGVPFDQALQRRRCWPAATARSTSAPSPG